MDKYDRLLVIGDIHGKWERFKSVYDKVGFNAEKDLIVFLGDYLDRGDAPCSCYGMGYGALWAEKHGIFARQS